MYNRGDSASTYAQCDPSLSQTSSQGRVKVEDALSYLDQVKTQFAEEPAVYTQFLDIMKDFKSQAIDTPGVITRVSKLFHGRPALIMGFNTFLPPGFEVKVDGQRITIKEPSGLVKVIQEGEGPSCPVEEEAATEKMEEAVVEEPEMEVISGDDDPTPEPTSHEDVIDKIRNIDPPPQGLQLNAAIGYVNKIKARFVDRPFVYKQFLEILHTYQHTIAEQSSTPATEESVLASVASLFENEPDLLTDFRLFLPDVHGLHQKPPLVKKEKGDLSLCSDIQVKEVGKEKEGVASDDSLNGETSSVEKFDPDDFPLPYRSFDVRELISKISVEDLAFFDVVRRRVTSSEYSTFLRYLNLYSISVLSAKELLTNLQSVLGASYPQLLNEMRQRFFPNEEDMEAETCDATPSQVTTELQQQIDYASCKQLGISYRSLPTKYKRPICSGRTALCNEVLNDTWVSFPSWSSEDSSCVSSKKTQYEDYVYRTEDERFELDIIIEVNKYAIETLESVRRRMSKMSTLEQEKFRLDEKLGGTSSSLMSRAIKRIYGEHAAKITEGLKRNPLLAVPKVIERLCEKQREWADSQTHMNRVWREQNDKHMVRALDHQSSLLKANDAKWIKAKQMVTQIEQLFDDRQQRSEDGLCEDVGPHIIIVYPEDKTVVKDVSDLIIHYIKRQSNIHKEEKQKIKKILKRYVTEWFFMKKEELSDCEDNDSSALNSSDVTLPAYDEVKEESDLVASTRSRLVYGGNSLFVFFRIHQIICDRLGKIKKKYGQMVAEFEVEQDMSRKQKEIYKEHGKSIFSHEQNASDTNNGLHRIRGPKRCPITAYADLIAEITSLLDNHVEPSVFEDNVRLLFPAEGYLLFTIDKLISVAARQLVQLATGNDGCSTIQMYDTYRVNTPFSVFDRSDRRLAFEGEYATAAESLLNCQNCFKVFIVNEDVPIVTIELVDTETGENADTERSQPNGLHIGNKSGTSVGGTSDDDDNEEEDDSSEHTRPSTSKSRCESTKANGDVTKAVSKKVRSFLRRNTMSRLRNTDVGDMFIAIDAIVVKGKNGVKLANKSFEGIIRKKRPDSKTVISKLERSNGVRRARAGIFVKNDLCSNWLSKGMAKVVMRHPKFSFLTYNRYLFKHSLTKDS